MRRLLILRYGDLALRAVSLPRALPPLRAVSHSAHCHDRARRRRIVPLLGQLDGGATLSRGVGLAHDSSHLASPPHEGARDWRTNNSIRALRRSRSIPQRLVYISASSGYGDRVVDIWDERRPRLAPDDG